MSKLKSAREYVELGWPVTPLYPYAVQGCSCSEGSSCHTPAKHPLLTEWQNPDNQARSLEEVNHVWGGDGNPNLNVGIVTGGTIFVVDIDPGKGGFDSWDRLMALHGDVDRTRVHRTGSGGRHYFFLVPDGQTVTNSNKNIKQAGYPGIDIRGTGGFVVAPPSVTNKGDYQVMCDAPVSEAPEWLIDLIRTPHVEGGPVSRDEVKERDELPEEIQRKADAYANTALNLELGRFIDEYADGEWDNLTNEIAFNCFTLANSPWNDLDLGDVESLLESRCNTDEGFSISRAKKCIRSAFNAVEKKDQVRDLPEELQEELTQLTTPIEQLSPNVFVKGDRKLVLTSAADIKMKRAKWTWKNRVALGTLSLVSGQAGLGKSTLVYWIVAQLTNGQLFGEFEGTPRDVIICATEDSWDHTIVPRLAAAGADRNRVFRADIQERDDVMEGLNLISDRDMLRQACEVKDIALVVLDPLLSRIGDKDSHKDAEVRQALEPLVAIADELSFSIIGLMHHNKSGSTDPLRLVMGSTAFGAVARSVHTVTPNADDPDQKLFGTIKNNLGKVSGDGEHDLDTMAFHIETETMETEDDDPQPLFIGKLVWDGDAPMTIQEALSQAAQASAGPGKKPKRNEQAATFLANLFDRHNGKVTRQYALDVGAQPMNGGFAKITLDRAMKDDRFMSMSTYNHDAGKKEAWWGYIEAFEEDDE